MSVVDERRRVNLVGRRWVISGAVGGGEKRVWEGQSSERGMVLCFFVRLVMLEISFADTVGEAKSFRVEIVGKQHLKG